MSVVPEPPVIFTRSGVAMILGVPLGCPPSVPVPAFCVAFPAMHGDPRHTTSQIATTENTKRRFAAAQRFGATETNKPLPVIPFTMERVFGFPAVTPASGVSMRCLTWPDWPSQKSASENLKREREQMYSFNCDLHSRLIISLTLRKRQAAAAAPPSKSWLLLYDLTVVFSIFIKRLLAKTAPINSPR